MFRTVITGTGSYIPPRVQTNADFAQHVFYSETHAPLNLAAADVVAKFKQITGIEERRYTTPDLNASDIGSMAARAAITDSGIDPETIDQIIVAHNFGNVMSATIQSDAVPSLANRIKHLLGIRNPACIAYDILFGCPGWVQGVINTDAFCRAGLSKTVLVVGTETLSRVIDPSDRDGMLFSDGAGAAILQWKDTGDEGPGILSTAAQSHSTEELDYINMGAAYVPGSDPHVRYIKMKGRKVYEYAMKYVPAAMKECMERSGMPIASLKKVFLHQANEKMDEGIIKRMYQLYGFAEAPEDIMPMCIHWLGNSSVATVPTLYDLVRHDQVDGHRLHSGDIVLFASVGAGMNVNAVCYRY